jgi:methane/ammonia monooxygenase subunit B
MRIRFAMMVSIVAILISSYTTRVFAHGEAADEPFLKDLTVAYYDVKISPTSIKVGEPVTITGSVKILETWPYTLDPPSIAYVTPVVPGPCFILTERTVNGESDPGSIFVQKGGIYNFKMVMTGRNPGHWHVHPGIAIQGTGTLLGPGQWVDVAPSATPFKMDVTLLDGKTVDLEHFGGAFVWWWSFAGLIIGVVWMLYWTVPKRTVTRLAVTLQVPVNDSAPDIGLITKRDEMWMNLLAAITILMLIVGWVYMAVKYPVRLPQQTVRFAPDTISPGNGLVSVHPKGATFDDKTDTLVINFEVKNNGASPVSLKQYVMAMTTFVAGDKDEIAAAGPGEFVGELGVEPNTPIEPGESRKVTLKMSNEIFLTERLVPLHDPQQLIAGILRFKDAEGKEDLVTMQSVLVPIEFRGQYLP